MKSITFLLLPIPRSMKFSIYPPSGVVLYMKTLEKYPSGIAFPMKFLIELTFPMVLCVKCL